MDLFALSDVHLSRYVFRCFSGDGLPSGEEQYFSQFGDRHASVFMQSKAQFFYIFHRGSPGTMRCFKACLVFADHGPLSSVRSSGGGGGGEAGKDEQVVWVVEVRPVQAIMSTITIIVIKIAL